MGKMNSVLVGKGRKSAGNITTYTRNGVSLFKQKPTFPENRKFSLAQLKQQSVFRFFKRNVDASALRAVVNLLFDAARKSGKSQTRFNQFYASYMPHLVAQKDSIYALDEAEIIKPSLFFGNGTTNPDTLIKGSMGDMIVSVTSAGVVTVLSAVLTQKIADINATLAASDTPFTTNDVFVSYIYATADNAEGYTIEIGKKGTVAASGSNTTVTIAPTAAPVSGSNMYAVISIGRTATGGALDTTQKYYNSNSASVVPSA